MTYWITRLNGAANKEATASGFIANRQAVQSAMEIGFEPLDYFRYNGEKESQDALSARLDGILAGIHPGDVVVYQYPMWQMQLRFEQRFLWKLKARKSVKTVALVWDILSWLHDDRDRDYTQDWSLKALNEFDLVIAANRKMAERLRTLGGVTRPILSMDLSDSRYSGPLKVKHFQKKLYFIGRLDRTNFEAYTAETPLELIGHPGPLSDAVKAQKNLRLLGEMPSDTIPSVIDGGFGIINYGVKDKETAVRFGAAKTYGQYNNPIKLSQYLAAGIPVIVDSQSAHADWVREKGVGLVMDDMNEIDAVFAEMTEDDYRGYLERVKPFQEAVSTGFFAKRALLEAIRVVELGFTDTLAVNPEDFI
jgi:hypothetical protein